MPYQEHLVSREWEIHPEVRTEILPLFLNIEADRKASPFNAILPMFVPSFLHPASTWVDAWAQEGNRWDEMYLFPPQSEVQVLACLESFMGQMALILEDCPPQILPFEQEELYKVLILEHPLRQKVRGV